MPTYIRTMSQLEQVVQAKVQSILQEVANEVKEEIDDRLREYYAEYKPSSYHRTKQLLNSCKIEMETNERGQLGAKIYIDYEALDYSQKGADPYKTIISADRGLHGGWHMQDEYQVPWEYVYGADGKVGNGTSIWSETIQEMMMTKWLIRRFIYHARKHGLKIK